MSPRLAWPRAALVMGACAAAACQTLLDFAPRSSTVTAVADGGGSGDGAVDAVDALDPSVPVDASIDRAADAVVDLDECPEPSKFCTNFNAPPYGRWWTDEVILFGGLSLAAGGHDGSSFMQARTNRAFGLLPAEAYLRYVFPVRASDKPTRASLDAWVMCPFPTDYDSTELSIELGPVNAPLMAAFVGCRPGASGLELRATGEYKSSPETAYTNPTTPDTWLHVVLTLDVEQSWSAGQSPGTASVTFPDVDPGTTAVVVPAAAAGAAKDLDMVIKVGLLSATKGVEFTAGIDDVRAQLQ